VGGGQNTQANRGLPEMKWVWLLLFGVGLFGGFLLRMTTDTEINKNYLSQRKTKT